MSGKPMSRSETKIEALKLQSSAYGVTVPVVGGVNRIAGNLIDYDDFLATPKTTTEEQAGKGGAVKTTNTTYLYSASVLMGICHGPVGAIARIWTGKELRAGGWSAANIASATETYTVPASGDMAYTLAHAATAIGVPIITGPGFPRRFDDPYVPTVQLALDVDFSLSGGVIKILHVRWRNKLLTINYQWGVGAPDLSPLAALGITLAPGDMGQTAPAWMTASHPDKALGYPGLAYVHAQAYQLGSGAQVENHSFEVQGSGAYRYGSSQPDCNPWEFGAGIMSNGRYGACMPAETIDAQDAIAYVAAAGLLMSPLLTEQVRAGDFIAELCRMTNCAPVWSFDRLRIVPYGDTTLTGNGVTYTPNVTPLYDLDDDHWLQEGDEDPLVWEIKEPSDRYNHVRVEFCDRANYYNKTIAEAKDDADIAVNGLRTMDTVTAPWICDAAVAAQVARTIQQRSLNITGTGTIKLPWAYCLLECMDLLTLTDPGLGFDHLPVRITSIEEAADGMLSIGVEDWPLGTAAATRYPNPVAGGYLHDYNAAPGSVQPPVIFEAPGSLTVNGLEVCVAATGLGAYWGGYRLWVSLDGTSYKAVGSWLGSRSGTISVATSAVGSVPEGGMVYGGTAYGTLGEASGSGGTVSVALLKGRMNSGTAAEAAALATLCYIGGANPEFVAYETATLTSALHYDLGGTIVRGAYGTAAMPHEAGAPFVRIDESVATSGVLDLSYVGKTIHFKLTSFNVWGGAEESLADVVDYTYAITGSQVYGNAGAQALAGIAASASDNILTAGEKPAVVLDVATILAEQTGIDAQAVATGFTAPCASAKTAYDAAVLALSTHLATLTTPTTWNVLTGDTVIVGPTFRGKFADVYATRQALLNTIAATAATMATWGNVSGVSVTTGQLAAGAATEVIPDAQATATATRTRPAGPHVFNYVRASLLEISWTNATGATVTAEVAIDALGIKDAASVGSAWLGCDHSFATIDGTTFDGDQLPGVLSLNTTDYQQRVRTATVSVPNGDTLHAAVYVVLGPTGNGDTVTAHARDLSCRITAIKR